MEYKDIEDVAKTAKTVNIKGSDYVEVNERVKMFRMLYPEGTIETELISNEGTPHTCIIKALVKNDGKLLATGYSYETENSTPVNRTSYIENCETSAVGRALGFLGIGIDASIASAEEVQTAVDKQGEPVKQAPKKQAVKKEQPVESTRRTQEELARLQHIMGEAGVSIADVCKVYKVDRLDELSEAQYENAMQRIGKKTEVA